MNRTWALVEGVHCPVYFAPEPRAAYEALGLRGFWRGYFASRAAALGEVDAALVTCTFHSFKLDMVARAIPEVWSVASPTEAAAARLNGVDAFYRGLFPAQDLASLFSDAADLAERTVSGAPEAGRPLFAAHRALPRSLEPHLRLFWACTALREFRGDGHVAALQAHDITGLQANRMMAALDRVPAEQRTFRGWSDDDWERAGAELRRREILTTAGGLTESGHRLRADIEQLTDRLADEAFRASGVDPVQLVEALTPIVRVVLASGVIPFPNAMGLPRELVTGAVDDA